MIACHGRRGVLEIDGDSRPFIVKGRRLRVACGDHVRFELRPGSEDLLVTSLVPRRNVLARQDPRAADGEVVAANLTQLCAVIAPLPQPDLFLLDRFLCAAEMMACRAAVLWNKCDLAPAPPEIAGEYGSLGYAVLGVSARTGEGMAALRTALGGQESVLVGQSGVGKSSLVNALVPGMNASVGQLSGGNRMGTHTTSAVLMYDLGDQGWLLDAPGVRDFVPLLPAGRRLDQGFPELSRLAPQCRFADCRHLKEPGCRVKDAVTAGEVSRRRFESYRRLLEAVTP